MNIARFKVGKDSSIVEECSNPFECVYLQVVTGCHRSRKNNKTLRTDYEKIFIYSHREVTDFSILKLVDTLWLGIRNFLLVNARTSTDKTFKVNVTLMTSHQKLKYG